MSRLDNISEPLHYRWHPKVECVEVAQEMDYNLGTALAYIWRCKHKHPSAVSDLRKAIQHLEFECARLEASAQTVSGTVPVPSFEQDDSTKNY